jgi:hypothetical protein
MGLAISGPWYLSTPTNDLFVNQANASYSVWVWVPPMSGGLVTTSGTQYSFSSDGVGPSTGAGIALSALGGANNWVAGARNVGASTQAAFKASTNLASMQNPGGVYHIAFTWTGGTQKCWINKVSQSITNGTTAGNTNSTTLAWWLGLNDTNVSANVIMWISQPAIWQGYVLTSGDIALLYGGTSPISASLGQMASAFWPLNGTVGAIPTTADTAIQNAGTSGAGAGNKYNFTTINSSSYGTAVYCPDLTSTALPALNWQTGDTFAGLGSGTDLNGRTSVGFPTVGTWQQVTGQTSGSLVGQGSNPTYVRRANINTSGYLLNTGTPGGFDQYGRLDFLVESNVANIPYIGLHFSPTSATGFQLGWSNGGLVVRVVDNINGTASIRAASSAISALTVGDTYTIEGYASGNGNITTALYLGSNQLAYITYADAANITNFLPGYPAIIGAGAVAESSSTGLWITNFRVAYGPPVVDLTLSPAALTTTLGGATYTVCDIPTICGTPNFLLCTAECRVGSGNVNDLYRDIVLWRQPKSSPQVVATPTVLLNFAAAGVNIVQNFVMTYVPSTGTVVAMYVEYPNGYAEDSATASHPATIKLITSTNEGASWSSPIDISAQIMQSGWASCFLGPGNGLIVLQNGQLGLTLSATTAANYTNVQAWYFQGTPNGQTWTIGGQIGTTQAGGGTGVAYGESKLVQLNNGTLLAWLRPSGAGSAIAEVWYTSTNGGSTWSALSPTNNPEMPACTVGLVADALGNLWNSYPNGAVLTTQARAYETVSYSANAGATFSIPQLAGYANFPQGSLLDGNANSNTSYGNGTGYSSLYADHKTGILWCFYERVWPGQSSYFSLSLAQISPTWAGGPAFAVNATIGIPLTGGIAELLGGCSG